MDPEKEYWQRQFYFLSSLGIFYIILIALFAIPLLGTFVVILIKGALDLRYVIITAGCVALVIIGWLAVKLGMRLWRNFRRDGALAGQAFRRSLFLGKPVEISVFNGMLKLSCGQDRSEFTPSLPQMEQPLLPEANGQIGAGGILDQLKQLSDLRQAGAIDENEFKTLKAMLIESNKKASGMREDEH